MGTGPRQSGRVSLAAKDSRPGNRADQSPSVMCRTETAGSEETARLRLGPPALRETTSFYTGNKGGPQNRTSTTPAHHGIGLARHARDDARSACITERVIPCSGQEQIA
jgi:hypothetical protein